MARPVLAKRPNFSDLEDEHTHWQKICRTCWQFVSQPYIKGLWYHGDDHINKAMGCQSLVPVNESKILRDSQYTCYHDLRQTKKLTGALKCINCGFPQRIDMLHYENGIRNCFCLTCDKPFKNVKQHFEKTHKGRPFEFKYLKPEANEKT